MKRIVPILLFFFVSCICTMAQETMRVETKTFSSPDFPFDREIFICTPINYDECNQSEVDVIYVFDSQWRSHFALVYGLLAEIQSESENPMSFIVVGISSPTRTDYQRSNDFLPAPTNVTYETPYYGNYDNSKKFIREDVMSYINDNYRTSGHTMAIGHSLGASFILNALVSEGLFDDYIAISPNFSVDDSKFARDFLSYDFNNGIPRFLFLTMANESEETGWGPDWRAAWNLVKSETESASYPEYVKMLVKEYPDYSHMRCYVECLMDALPLYGLYRQNTSFTDDETLYPVHIELECPWAEGDVFITGNQPALADWNPEGVKLNQVNDSTYSIDLNLRLPAEFKFTLGSWDTPIIPDNAYNNNLRIYSPEKANKRYTAL